MFHEEQLLARGTLQPRKRELGCLITRRTGPQPRGQFPTALIHSFAIHKRSECFSYGTAAHGIEFCVENFFNELHRGW